MVSAKNDFSIASMALGILGGVMMCGFVHASAFAMSLGNLMQPIAAMVDAAVGMGAASGVSAAGVTAAAGGALVLTP